MTVLLTVDDRTAQLAKELAKASGKSVEDVVRDAVANAHKDVIATVPGETSTPFDRGRAIDALVAEMRLLPILDHRTDDEILGYDEHGLPS